MTSTHGGAGDRPPRPRRYLLVANGDAGSTGEAAVRAALGVLEQGAEVEAVWTSSTEELDAVLDALGDRALVVAGGDGSLHLAVARLRARDRLDVPVGLVPLGTGNDFARAAGLPQDAAEAAGALLVAEPRPVDLVLADHGDIVVNAAHAGLGAAASEAAADLKGALGPLAYPLGALRAGVREGGYRLRVDVDGRTVHDGTALMIGVMNGCTIGGGTPLCAAAAIDDGAVDAVVVTAVGPAARTAFATALRNGTHLQRDDVAVHRGSEVTIAGEPVRHVVDGELTEELDAVTYRVQRGAWHLLG